MISLICNLAQNRTHPRRSDCPHYLRPMKIWSKMMKLLLSWQHFPKSIGPSRTGNSHANSQNRAKSELFQDFMHVLIICQFDEDPIRNEISISQTTFSPLYVYGRLKGQVTCMRIVWSGPKSNLSKILCPSSLSASLMKIPSKIKSTIFTGQHFPYHMSMGPFGCCGNQSSDQLCPKT